MVELIMCVLAKEAAVVESGLTLAGLACCVAWRETLPITLGVVAWDLETDGGSEVKGVDPVVDFGVGGTDGEGGGG